MDAESLELFYELDIVSHDQSLKKVQNRTMKSFRILRHLLEHDFALKNDILKCLENMEMMTSMTIVSHNQILQMIHSERKYFESRKEGA